MKPSRFDSTVLTLCFAFLYIPIIILIVYSFNASKLVTVWGGFSLEWYRVMWSNQGLMDAAWVTARVGMLSATLGTILGTLAALTLVRFPRFPGRIPFTGMIYAPLVMPEVITGLSMLLLFVAMNIDRGFWTVTIAHTTFTMCYVAVIVQSRLLTFDWKKRQWISAAHRSRPSSASRCRSSRPPSSRAGCWPSRCRWMIW